jgi:hypothetical protein
MKTNYILIGALLLIGHISCETENIEPEPLLEITEQETRDLLFLREEEKLAYDVYLYAFNKYDLQIFKNISKSEMSHTGQVLELINKFSLEDPVKDNTLGIFENEELQLLYDNLTMKVDISKEAALEVGATIEDLDIKDIDLMLLNTDNQEIKAVYDNLICGSRNHLRSFVSNLTTEYIPQFISQESYFQIINSEKEKCSSN